MENLKDIQSLINQRAEKKLKKDIAKTAKMISESLIGKANDKATTFPTQKNPNGESPYFFFAENGDYFQGVFKNLLPKYIEDESLAFMNEIENIKNQVENLLNDQEMED